MTKYEWNKIAGRNCIFPIIENKSHLDSKFMNFNLKIPNIWIKFKIVDKCDHFCFKLIDYCLARYVIVIIAFSFEYVDLTRNF